jgi:uncharacterized protein (UPF0210 family)
MTNAMKIRSITYFLNPGWPLVEKKLQAASNFLVQARSAYESVGYDVQTLRLATIPFPLLLGADRVAEAPKLARQLSVVIQKIGVSYAALGPALPDMPGSYDIIPDAVAASDNIFFSAVMADAKGGISLQAVRACADVIVRCATIMPEGFANLRFAALANVAPGAPFFPAAYHKGNVPSFALATEAADLAVSAFESPRSVDDGRHSLVHALERNAKKLVRVADKLVREFKVKFGGIDFSLAPYPEMTRSLGAAMENVGVPRVGLHGSLAAAAILAEAVDRADFPHVGFSGLMLPVLEDALLAKNVAEKVLTVKDVLLYSAVCGTGLDTIPLPGNTTSAQIAPLLLDLSALALRLDKPLTARLMPIPGKQAGEHTNFDFAFFANSRVMSMDAETMQMTLARTEHFKLRSRKQ